ncbi:MAG: hypothetical protein ACI9O0_000093 [Paracoccaceae bacterium]
MLKLDKLTELKSFNSNAESAAPWQVVLVLWGKKFSSKSVNMLVRNILLTSKIKPNIVLITDQERSDFLYEINMVKFPPFFNQTIFKTQGCHAKLAIFQRGVLQKAIPTIYLDLDSVIFGDLYKAFSFVEEKSLIQIMPSTFLRFSKLSNLLLMLTKGRISARGNSSCVVFHPSECYNIAEKFQSDFLTSGFVPGRKMAADDKFISFVSQEKIRLLPKAFAGNFARDYMHRLPFVRYFQNFLSQYYYRKPVPVLLTFAGLTIEPENMVKMEPLETLRDPKKRILIWDDKFLGPVKMKLETYFC